MSLNTMARRMSLEVPGLADTYAATLLSEALGHIEDEQMWSFQLQESGFLTPGLLFASGGVSAGTVTFTSFSNKVIGSTAASAAWAAYVLAGTNPPLTVCQIRSPYYSLYNIVAYDTTSNPPFGTFTLDRPWMEPGGTQMSYMIYQAYFAVPVSDFRRFVAVRDTTNNAPMDYWSMSQKDLAMQDPERVVFDDPSFFVPYEIDKRAGSSTLGYMLYELWPHPLSVLPYTFGYIRKGPSLVNPSDTPPYPITESMILWRAKEAAFLYKEAQKGEEVQRGAGADFKFLAQAANAEYRKKLKDISARDRDMVDLYFNRWNPNYANGGEPFATVNSQLNVGRM